MYKSKHENNSAQIENILTMYKDDFNIISVLSFLLNSSNAPLARVLLSADGEIHRDSIADN